jgi:hypothetical protein
LKSFDLASILEHVEQYLNFPSRPVPVDQFGRLGQRTNRAIGQQAPFDTDRRVGDGMLPELLAIRTAPTRQYRPR